MKKILLIMTALLFWNCTDYAGDWENNYGAIFAAEGAQPSGTPNGQNYTSESGYPNGQPNYDGETGYTVPGIPEWTGEPSFYMSSAAAPLSSSSWSMPGSSANPVNNQPSTGQTFLWDENNPNVCMSEYGHCYWEYDDGSDGGMSYISWHGGSLANSVDDGFGICGTAYFDRGTSINDPFVGVGFDVLIDASSWHGVCVTYTSQVPVKLEMGLGDAMDATIAYNNPLVTLDKSENRTERCFKWSDFKQQWSSGTTISGEEAVKSLSSLKIKIQGLSGTATFAIYSVSFN